MALKKAASRLTSERKLPRASANDGRLVRFRFHQMWATGTEISSAAYSSNFGQSNHIQLIIGPAVLLPTYGVGLQIVKLTWTRPLASQRAGFRPFQRWLNQAISTVSRGALDLRSVGNADIPQCPVIEFHQGSDSLLDFTFVVPMPPSARNGTPRLGGPIAVVRPLALKRRRAVKFGGAGVRGRRPGSRPGSIGLVLKFRSRHLGMRRGGNDSEIP